MALVVVAYGVGVEEDEMDILVADLVVHGVVQTGHHPSLVCVGIAQLIGCITYGKCGLNMSLIIDFSLQ